MHTTRIGTTTFHHDGDFSGEVHIVVPNDRAESVSDPGAERPTHTIVRLPYTELRDLVLGQYQNDLIDMIEQIDVSKPEGRKALLRLVTEGNA